MFELIAEWAKAPSGTASAGLIPDGRFMGRDIGSSVRSYGGRTTRNWDVPRVLRRREVAYEQLVDEISDKHPSDFILIDEITRPFAWRVDAMAWIAAMRLEGWGLDYGPIPLATWRYAGESDSPANAWSVRLIRIVDEKQS